VEAAHFGGQGGQRVLELTGQRRNWMGLVSPLRHEERCDEVTGLQGRFGDKSSKGRRATEAAWAFKGKHDHSLGNSTRNHST